MALHNNNQEMEDGGSQSSAGNFLNFNSEVSSDKANWSSGERAAEDETAKDMSIHHNDSDDPGTDDVEIETEGEK